MLYTSCLKNYRTNEVLRSYEITKDKKNLKASMNDSLVPNLPAKLKNLLKLAKNS